MGTEIEPRERRCSCGNGVDDFWVRPDCRYSLFGSLMYLIGATPRPVRVDYKCARCGEVVASSRDEDVLEEHRYGVRPGIR